MLCGSVLDSAEAIGIAIKDVQFPIHKNGGGVLMIERRLIHNTILKTETAYLYLNCIHSSLGVHPLIWNHDGLETHTHTYLGDGGGGELHLMVFSKFTSSVSHIFNFSTSQSSAMFHFFISVNLSTLVETQIHMQKEAILGGNNFQERRFMKIAKYFGFYENWKLIMLHNPDVRKSFFQIKTIQSDILH